MEQKAVVYKTIKGMSRDMSISSGNNDYSYENYNIRITTRGKEDSLVVTNEKGTESKIIASREVLKTINTVFKGKEIDFNTTDSFIKVKSNELYKYSPSELFKKVISENNQFDYTQITNDEYLENNIEFYIKNNSFITPLNSSNNKISFSLNTEYPVESDLSFSYNFSIKETPIKYEDTEYYLLDDGKYSKYGIGVIEKNKNYGLIDFSLKELILGGETNDYSESNITPDLTKWNKSYKKLFNKLTEKKYFFDTFNTNVYISSSISSSKRSSLSINLTEIQVSLPSDYLNVDDNFNSNKITEKDIENTENTKKAQIILPRLCYLYNNSLSLNYPNKVDAIYKPAQTYEYRLRIALFRTIYEIDTSSTIYNRYKPYMWYNLSDGIHILNNDELYVAKNSNGAYNHYYYAGYIEYIFELPKKIEEYFKIITDNNNAPIFIFPKKYFFSTIEKPGYNGNLDGVGDFGSTYIVTSTEDTNFYDSVPCWISGGSKSFSFYHTKNINSSGPDKMFGFLTTDETNRWRYIITPYQSGPYYLNDIITYTNINKINSQNPYGQPDIDYIGNSRLPLGYNIISNNSEITRDVSYSENTDQINTNTLTYYISNYSAKFNSDIRNLKIKNISVEDNNIKILFDNDNYIIYNKNTFTIKARTESNSNYEEYYLYQIMLNYIPVPFIIYTKKKLVFIDNNNIVDIYRMNENGYMIKGFFIPENILRTIFVGKISGGEGSAQIDINNKKIYFTQQSGSTSYDVKNIIQLKSLPVFNYTNETTNNEFTTIDSKPKITYNNPNFDTVVNYFGFTLNNFKLSADINNFRLKCSNNDWDEKFIYKWFERNVNNKEYIKKYIPISILDTYQLVLSPIKINNKIYLKVNIKKPSNSFFDIEYDNKDISLTIINNLTKTETVGTLNDFLNGKFIEGNYDLANNPFYIKEIFYNPDKINLSELETENILDNVSLEKSIKKNYSVQLEKLKHKTNNTTYIKQIIEIDNKQTISICKYSFNENNYKNKFYSIIDNNILISNFGKYHALTIPGRILGATTLNEYVILFFHYSAPALYFYEKINNNYKLCKPNNEDISNKIFYTKNEKGKYEEAIINGILQTDENEDYVNGKNQDYIICLKYINAKPNNKENEWITIVDEINNASTLTNASTNIIEKKPYYYADILYSGNLGFNKNYGIECISYYESKDVIKVYWTDGKNQPRMINILESLSKRNGNIEKWDNKSFDFIQEISGNENFEITKKYGGGAFPAGTVQYYFTYSNLGGCETNPFITTPLYYTSTEDSGNSVLKITDNVFEIKLTNLSKRFNYINIYSVVRTSKDLAPICKKVAYLSFNGKTNISFTDNNLLGEIIDNNYLLMLQGTPISALTMAEKDNTLFLGNINKLQNTFTSEEKNIIKNYFDIKESKRLYQNYNPNEENWYENVITNKDKKDLDGNVYYDEENNIVKTNSISLEQSSDKIKTFMYNEWYRLGVQFQDKYGKWTDPIYIKDVQCKKNITTTLTEEINKEDNSIDVTNLKSYIPYFYLSINQSSKKDLENLLNKYSFVRIRPVIVYPDISSRNVLCQGLINPTLCNVSDRMGNNPFGFASYFFRPIPPAISEQKDESGEPLHNIDFKKGTFNYPVEFRHGYPIAGYEDAIDDGLAKNGGDVNSINTSSLNDFIKDYLGSQSLTKVKLTSKTIGWFIAANYYMRDGELIINSSNNIVFKKGCKIYSVSSKTNRGHINFDHTISNDTTINKEVFKAGNSESSSFNAFIGKAISYTIPKFVDTKTEKAFGFSSHIHYFKNTLLTSNPFTSIVSIWDVLISGTEIIKSIGNITCSLFDDKFIFNEGSIIYEAKLPVTIKIIPISKVGRKKHRMLKRKVYSVDVIVESEEIKIITSGLNDKYIDDADSSNNIAKKAYFALNNGEIQSANGNKIYNLYKDGYLTTLKNNYDSSEISEESKKQSVFLIDESICTFNSPEIEYNSTIQKIDLSNYKLNIVGSSNITGYSNHIEIDAETPPLASDNIVCEGFKHENHEVENFDKNAFKYQLSGAYWYDGYFSDEDKGGVRSISDQHCWWVYPFNRQILNNSKNGQNGKCRTKKWVNYHYSAFNDYFGNASISIPLKDNQQIYGSFQSNIIKTSWFSNNKSTIYFGSVDTAYTNPVPLVGLLGGSNMVDENAFEQTLAISPHANFIEGSSYSSANYSDIVPITFNSNNHFVIAFDRDSNTNKKQYILPEYFSDENILKQTNITNDTSKIYYCYQIMGYYDIEDNSWHELENYYIIEPFVYDLYSKTYDIYEKEGDTLKKLDSNLYFITFNRNNDNTYTLEWNFNLSGRNIIINDLKEGEHEYIQNGYINDGYNFVPIRISKQKEEITVYVENKNIQLNEFIDDDLNINEETKRYELTKEYDIEAIKMLCNDTNESLPTHSIKPYVFYQNKDAGLYKFGHIYIGQLERGATKGEHVFNEPIESVLLQHTWIPAGNAISITSLLNNNSDEDELKWTEGDTFYQRYDCLKTFAHSDSDVNQVVEYLSTMIQSRINLDGIYSLRGNVDNVGANLTNTNLLNEVYSQTNNYFTYSITDPYISDITEYSNMFTWTLTKQPMSRTDNWLAINLISYYNATGIFGKITRLINYRNQLFCFQEDAISQIAYNERVALSTSDGVPVEIGNSGKVQGLNYITSNVGCQNRWSIAISKSALYWVDDRRAEIYKFNDGLEPFSTINGFSDWVKENTYGEDWKPIKSTNVPITTYYDNNNDDIYFVTEKDCLGYNEKLNAFESFYSYEDSFILNNAGNTIIIKELDSKITDFDEYSNTINDTENELNNDSWWSNGIKGDGLSHIELMHEGNYNEFFGIVKPFYLRFKVYPTDLQRDKIFTNLEFNTDSFDNNDVYISDDTFTRIRIWNEYQWGQMTFNKNPYGTTSFKKRFRTWYAQLPRANYYPTGMYDDYDYLYKRQPQWLEINNTILNDTTLVYHKYWNNKSINDRIRNPWVWMELFNRNESFKKVETNINEEYYNNNKERLYYKFYSEIDFNVKDLYENLYKYNDNDKCYELITNRNEINNTLKLYKADYVSCKNKITFEENVEYYYLEKDNNRMEIHDIILKYFEV